MDRATDFQLTSIKVDGKEIQSLFVGLEVYENLYVSAITGSLMCVETGGNQFLADNEIEGNEEIIIEIETAGESYMFEGFINKISNRTLTPNGQSTYVIEFVSPFARNNEQERITTKYKDLAPSAIIDDAVFRLNDEAEKTSEWDRNMADGEQMEFIASNWTPLRTIQYVQRNAIPLVDGGKSTITKDSKEMDAQSSGKGGLLFWETSKGLRCGSVSQLMKGELGERANESFKYELSNQGQTMEKLRNQVLSFNNVQNNDVQTQQRGGAFKSKLVSFDMDTGMYAEQEWESPMATEKQKKTSKKSTRVMMVPHAHEKFGLGCERVPGNDSALQSSQQGVGTFSNMDDSVCQYTLPVRTDLNAGDGINIEIFETSAERANHRDDKYSGEWILSAVAHHFLLESGAAYTRVTAIRATNQTDAFNSSTLS